MRSSVPPFQIGDKAIRIGPSYPEYNMFKRRTYTVSSITYCCSEMGWRISVEESIRHKNGPSICEACDQHTPEDWRAVFFTKPDEMLSEHTVDSLLEELKTTVPISV